MIKNRLRALVLGIALLGGTLLGVVEIAKKMHEDPLANKPLSGFVGLGGAPQLKTSAEYKLVASHDFVAYRFGALHAKTVEVDSLQARNIGLMLGTHFNINSIQYWMADEAVGNPARDLWDLVTGKYLVSTTLGDTASITGNDPLFRLDTEVGRGAIIEIIADYVHEAELNWILLDYCPQLIFTNEANGDLVFGDPDYNRNKVGYYADAEDIKTVQNSHVDFIEELREALPTDFLIIASGGRGVLTSDFAALLDGVYLKNFPATYFNSPSYNYDYAFDIEEDTDSEATTLKAETRKRYKNGSGYVMMANSAIHGSARVMSALHDGLVYIEEDLDDPDAPTTAEVALNLGVPTAKAVRANISGGYSITRQYEEGEVSIEVVSNAVDSYIDGELFYNDGGMPDPPAAPANPSMDDYGDNSLEMSYDAVVSADSYNIYRGATSGAQDFVPIGTSETTDFTDSPMNYTPYYYTVAAVVDDLVGEESDEIRGYANEWTHGTGECLESRQVSLITPDFGPGGIVGADSGAVDFSFYYEEDAETYHMWIIPGEHLHWFYFTSDRDATWFEHYTSTTLEPDEWTRQPNVDLYDKDYAVTHVWAPHVFRYMGTYYMTYTAVDNQYGTGVEIQRIMMCQSDDLVTWTNHTLLLGRGYGVTPEDNYKTGVDPFALWSSGTSWTNAMRDGQILRNENDTGWLMFVSLTGDVGEIGSDGMVLGLAESLDADYDNKVESLMGDYYLYDWVASTSTTGDAESPQIWEIDGTYFVQHSTNTGIIGQVVTSTTPSNGDRDGSSDYTANVTMGFKGLEVMELTTGEYIIAYLKPSWVGNASPTNGWEYYQIDFERMFIWDDYTFTYSNIMTPACFEGDILVSHSMQLPTPLYGAWAFGWPATPTSDDFDNWAEYDACIFHAQPLTRASSTYAGFVDEVRTRNEDWIPLTYLWVMGARDIWENSSGLYQDLFDFGEDNSDGYVAGMPGGLDGVLDYWLYDADGNHVEIRFEANISYAYNWAAPGFADALADLYITYMESGDNVRDYVGVFLDWLYYPNYPTWCFPGGVAERDNIDFNENGIPWGDETTTERALMLAGIKTFSEAFRIRSGNENFLVVSNGDAGYREVTGPYFDGAMFEEFAPHYPNTRTELLQAYNDVPGWGSSVRISRPLLWYQAAQQDSIGPSVLALATIGKGISGHTGASSEFVPLLENLGRFGPRIDASVTVSATGDTSFAKFYDGADTTYIWAVSRYAYPFAYLITRGRTGMADADTVSYGSQGIRATTTQLSLTQPVYGAWDKENLTCTGDPPALTTEQYQRYAEADVSVLDHNTMIKDCYIGLVDSVRAYNPDWIPLFYVWGYGARPAWEAYPKDHFYRDLYDTMKYGDMFAKTTSGTIVRGKIGEQEEGMQMLNPYAPGLADALGGVYAKHLNSQNNNRSHVGFFVDWFFSPLTGGWWAWEPSDWALLDLDQDGKEYDYDAAEELEEEGYNTAYLRGLPEAFRTAADNHNLLIVPNGNVVHKSAVSDVFDGGMHEDQDVANSWPRADTDGHWELAVEDVYGMLDNDRVDPPLALFQAQNDSSGFPNEALATIAKGVGVWGDDDGNVVSIPRKYDFGEMVGVPTWTGTTPDTVTAEYLKDGVTVYVRVVEYDWVNYLVWPYIIYNEDGLILSRGGGWPDWD